MPYTLLLALALAAPGQEFSFRATPEKLQSGHWRVAGLPRTYFPERLPALFERTLALDEFDAAEGALEWIFTGEQGGFTVRITRDRVGVAERYYDSPGLADPAAKARHPEKVAGEASEPLPEQPRRVAVRLDANLGLTVLVNGRETLRRKFQLDVSRHQLSWSGSSGSARGRLLPVETGKASVKVEAARRRQTMLGFGGITTPTAFHELSAEGKRRWWKILAEYNLLLHREYPMGARLDAAMDNWDRMGDAVPHYYGDNFPNGEISDFSYMRNVRRLGGKVLFEFWALPDWARRDWTDPQGKVHAAVADVEPWTRAMVRYCEVSRERTGAAPEIVGIQNEVAQPPEIWRQMTLRLRQALDRAGFRAVRIHMRDDSALAGGIECARAFRGGEAVWKAIDYSASHQYDYQKFLFHPDGYDALLERWHEAVGDKPFLSTELSVNSNEFQGRSYRLALGMGQLYHKTLTLGNASAILYCWLLLNVEQPSYGWTRTLFVPDPAHGFMPAASSYQARVFGAFSRRIRAGMVRVDATSSNADVLAAAFSGANGGRTLVLLNRSARAQKVRIEWAGEAFRYLEWAGPYDDNTVAAAPAKSEISIEPGAIATLSTEPLGVYRAAP